MSQFFVIVVLYQNKGVVMKRLLISAIAVSALVGNLYAGGKLVEPPQVPPIPVVTDIWTAPYIGAQLGFITGKGKVIVSNITAKTVKPSGFTAGVFAGYNWRTKSDILFGLEGDINYISAKKRVNLITRNAGNGNNLSNVQKPVPIKIDMKLRQYWDASLRVRLGKVIDNKYLPYITAGVAWTKVGLSYPGAPSPYNTVKKKTLTGWTAGAGVEVKVNKNVNVRIQYRYSDYGKETITHSNLNSTLKFKTHSIRAGVSYSFN